MILSFHKKPGAFVDREYPKGITKKLTIDDIDQNKIYSLHRMRNTKPNYLFIKAKGVQIASFFSGFDTKQFIGRPNQCVSIILENNENPTKWEDHLRRLTSELLPELAKARGDEIVMSGLDSNPKYTEYDQQMGIKFDDLQAGRVQPMLPGEGEHLEGEGATVETISSIGDPKPKLGAFSLTKDDIAAATSAAKAINQIKTDNAAAAKEENAQIDSIGAATKQMEEMEKEGLRNEIRKIHAMIQEKDDRIRALESRLQDTNAGDAAGSDVAKIRGEYEALIASKDQELDTWREKVAQLNENNFINQDNIMKLTEQIMMLSDEAQHQSKIIVECRKQIKVLEATQGAPSANDIGAKELDALRTHLAEIEEQLKQSMNEKQEKADQMKKMFIKNKSNEEKIEDLTHEVETLKSQAAQPAPAPKAAENPDQEKIISDLQKKLESKTAALATASSDLETTKTQVKQAQNALAAQNSHPLVQPEPVALAIPSGPDPASLAKIANLEGQVKKLQEQISAAPPASSGIDNTRLLETRVKDLEAQIEAQKAELINAKKTIKIQRREVDNLQRLLGIGGETAAAEPEKTDRNPPWLPPQ